MPNGAFRGGSRSPRRRIGRFSVPAEDCKKRRAAQNPNFPLEVIDRMADSLGTDWRDIAALFRGKIITIIPDGETVIQPGDHAVIVTRAGRLKELDSIVEGR